MGKALAATPLNTIERRDLRNAEAAIEKGQLTFVEVGNALLTVREGKLYRESHKTFEAYCKDRWGFERRHAYRLIGAAAVAEEMSPIGHKIKNESQARELGKVPEDQRQAVIEQAAEATNGKPTAKAIQEAAEEIVEPEEEDEAQEGEPTVTDRMREANAVLDGLARKITAITKEAEEIDNPHLSDAKHGRLETLKAQLRSATGTVRAAKGAGICTYCNGGLVPPVRGCKPC